MRCADFHVFSLRVQGPRPLPPTAQVILPSCRRQRPLPGEPIQIGIDHPPDLPLADPLIETQNLDQCESEAEAVEKPSR